VLLVCTLVALSFVFIITGILYGAVTNPRIIESIPGVKILFKELKFSTTEASDDLNNISVSQKSKAPVQMAINNALATDVNVIPTSRAENCSCVVFRLDDISNWLGDVQIKLMNLFIQKHANLTIAIIGNEFNEDPKLIHFIKTHLSNFDNKSFIEVGSHGWNHEDFRKFNETEQSNLLNKSKERLEKILAVNTTLFVPPGNVLDNDTIQALKENHFRYVSPRLDYTNEPVYKTKDNLYFIPMTVIFDGLNKSTGLYEPRSYKAIIEGIQKALSKYKMAVVGMHPMDFALRNNTQYINKVDENQLQKLTSILEYLQKKKIPIVTISAAADHLNYFKNN